MAATAISSQDTALADWEGRIAAWFCATEQAMTQGDMQIKLTDPRTNEEWGFAPMRDIAYFHHQLVALVGKGLEKSRWEPWLKEYLDFTGTTEEDVLRAFACYYRFCSFTLDPDRLELKNPGETLEAAGFFTCTKAAQLAVIAKVGQISTGAWWAGIKSATPLGQIPATIKQLERYAQEVEQLLSTRWSQHGNQGSSGEGQAGGTVQSGPAAAPPS